VREISPSPPSGIWLIINYFCKFMNQIFFDRSGNQVVKTNDDPILNRMSAYEFSLGTIKFCWSPDSFRPLELPGAEWMTAKMKSQPLKREVVEEVGLLITELGENIHTRKQNFYADDKKTYFIQFKSFSLSKNFLN